MEVIKTKNLTKYYGKIRGIDSLDLRVEQGDFFGFIGPNGAGKSTAIRTLLGLISPTSGEGEILGRPLSQAKEYLKDIGYLPSEAAFYGKMKVGELIEYSAGLRGLDCKDEAKRLCDRLELDIKKSVDQLSLGNRKKVGIVCAMQHRPSLYIMDEPTGGLDPLIQREFFDLLGERRAEGATVFFSSHVLSEVQQHCNKAAIIREGRIAVQDSIENLARSSTKKVTVHGTSEVPEGIEARSVSQAKDSVSFLYRGDIKELLRRLYNMPVTDLTVTEPDLEEIFMHYYRAQDEAGEAKL